MSNLIAEYYINEIDGWKEGQEYYQKQIDQIIEWLKEIIQFDTVPGLANSVSLFIGRLTSKSDEFSKFEKQILDFRESLIVEDDPIEDIDLTSDFQMQQRVLRDTMKNLEKEYLELKYAGDEFIAETLVMQKHDPDSKH
jgi:hypothetical protein